ncbi:MAG: hypothetical protein QOK18_1090 [Mycobacterium sp.]|jgi:WXG100 family type VII secretion target|nr:hypothetical protein [Mycobacterium sp.]MDT5401257.1 hypothetical protein [Mycobacterium sp.]MDT7757134.1 hypothetical protein [Mycobacterium sp.]
MALMNTDSAVLSKEASSFERIASELKGVIAQVESTAGALSGQWRGQAATAAQAAIQRFHEAATRQVQALNDISNSVHTAAAQYASTDEEQGHSLSTAMGSSLGGPVSADSAGPSVAPQAVAAPQATQALSGAGAPVMQAASLGGGSGSTPTIQAASFSPTGFKQDTPTPMPAPPPAPQTGEPIKVPQRPYPPTVINTNATPGAAEASGTGTSSGGVAPPKCDAGDLIQHGLEVVGGGLAAGAAVPAEIPSMGSSTAILIGGAAGVTAGVNGFKDCAQ